MQYIGKTVTGGKLYRLKSFVILDSGGGYWDAKDEGWTARGRIMEATHYQTKQQAEQVAHRLPMETGATGVEVVEV